MARCPEPDVSAARIRGESCPCARAANGGSLVGGSAMAFNSDPFNSVVASVFCAYGAVMAVIGGRRVHSGELDIFSQARASSRGILRKYFDVDQRFRRSRFYLVWVYLFAGLMSLASVYFLWGAVQRVL